MLLLGALGFIAWTLYAGPDLNWDLLNYHLYVGLHASGDTLATDFFPASSQSYLAPYGYWPLAKMVAAKWPAMVVGSVLAAIHSLAAIVTWFLSKQLFPGASGRAVMLRAAATVIAVACPLVLTAVGTSFIDLTAGVPTVLGVALLLNALASNQSRTLTVALAGLCFGLASALKLSSAPFAVAAFLSLMILWFLRPDVRWRSLLVFGSAMAAGFIFGYGYWGFQLWREFGNPFFPLFNSFFQEPIVQTGLPASGVQLHPQSFLIGIWDWFFSSTNRHQRFMPRDVWDWLLRPLYMVDPVANVYTEVRAPDARFVALFGLAPFAVWKLRAQVKTSGLVVLLLIFLVGWIVWMATSGNGRYLMPWALIAGPALVGCASVCWRKLELTALMAITIFVCVQSALMWEGVQFRWAGSAWQEQYISAKLPREVTDQPVTFVSFEGQSASWLSAFVHPKSRFVNPGAAMAKRSPGKGADRFAWGLAESPEIIAVFRLNYHDSNGKPYPPTPGDQEDTTARTGVQVDSNSCMTGSLVESIPERTAEFVKDGLTVKLTAVQGFFFCRAAFKPDLMRAVPIDPVRLSALRNIENACPRQFPRGGGQTVCTSSTCFRTYPTTDTQLIIAQSGEVTARYYGAVQRPYLGNAADLSRDASKVRCHEQLGRYSPWSPGANLLSDPPLTEK